jgi:hypothetical protein
VPSATIASFDYRGVVCALEIVLSEPPRLAFICPVCGVRAGINPRRHEAIVNMKTGAVTIRPAVICPKRECGWHVTIAEGRAADVEPPESVTAPVGVRTSHPERAKVCTEPRCGRSFSTSRKLEKCRLHRGAERRRSSSEKPFLLRSGALRA